MKIFLGLFILNVAINVSDVMAETCFLSGNVSSLVCDENIVSVGTTVNAAGGDTINVLNGTTLRNMGTINGHLNVGDYNLRIYNSGSIVGNIIACGNNRICVTQVITSSAELNKLNIIDGKFEVSVDNASDNINLRDLKNLSASKYEFNNSVIVIDDFSDWQNWTDEIFWTGGKLYINNSYTVNSGEAIKNIPSGSSIEVKFLDEDKLHKPSVVSNENEFILKVVRETDYEKIFNDNRGLMLQKIRSASPNDKLLAKMDRASNMVELQRVMNSSYRFNPAVLMRPIGIINDFSSLDALFYDRHDTGIKPFWIMSEYINDFGARLYVNIIDNDNFVLNIGGRVNKFDYQNYVDDFSGFTYGADINSVKKIDKFLIKSYAGFNLISFNADYIYINNEIKSNPFGYSLYGGIDGFYNYELMKDLFLIPFIGMLIERYSVLNFSDNDIDLRAGLGAQYDFTLDGIKYKYATFIGGKTDTDLFGIVKIGFESVTDKAGISLDFGVYETDDALNYQASINANIYF